MKECGYVDQTGMKEHLHLKTDLTLMRMLMWTDFACRLLCVFVVLLFRLND